MASFWDTLERVAKETNFWVTFRSGGHVLVQLEDYERVSFSVKVFEDRSWKAKLFGIELDPMLSMFCLVPKILDSVGVTDLLHSLNNCEPCPGNPDFTDVCRTEAPFGNAIFCSPSGVVYAKEMLTSNKATVRHVDCQLITSQKTSRCELCQKTRLRLSSLRVAFNKNED